MAWRFMCEQPGDFWRLVRSKWELAFQAANLGWNLWNLPGGLSGIRRPVDMFVPERGPRLQMVSLPLTRSIMTAFVVLALAMLVVEGLSSHADRNYTASGTTLPGRQKLNPDLPVRIDVLPHS